jgi:hypothetical protein
MLEGLARGELLKAGQQLVGEEGRQAALGGLCKTRGVQVVRQKGMHY